MALSGNLKARLFFLSWAWMLVTPWGLSAWAADEGIPVVESGAWQPPADSGPQSVDDDAVNHTNAPAVTIPDTNQSKLVVELLERVDRMQKDVSQLRGRVEELDYKLQQMEKEQRSRYLDLDQRLQSFRSHSTRRGAGDLKTPPANTPNPQRNASSQEEQELYQQAISLMRNRNFPPAIQVLETLLRKYPGGSLVANAHYWLGEIYFAQGNYAQAKSAFETVIEQYPKSVKLADASYKLGVTLSQMGQTKAAMAQLKSVIIKYPDTAVSKLATDYLKVLGN